MIDSFPRATHRVCKDELAARLHRNVCPSRNVYRRHLSRSRPVTSVTCYIARNVAAVSTTSPRCISHKRRPCKMPGETLNLNKWGDEPSRTAFKEPLTTIFNPDPSCTDETYLLSYTSADCTHDNHGSACHYFHQGPSTSKSDCMPVGWTQGSVGYFSPGRCPAGYMTACKALVDVDDGGTNTETRVTCCPV